MDSIRALIRDIPNFPKPDILFKDITPVLGNPKALKSCVDAIVSHYCDCGITAVVGMESRGFIFGTPVAYCLGSGFIPIRKPGKLPYYTHRVDYTLEYGTDALEMHVDGVSEKDNVLIVDDLLATGGTAKAAVQLVQQAGAKVAGCAFVLELGFLQGRTPLETMGVDVHSLMIF